MKTIINTPVVNRKGKKGTISRIITKYTGYVEVLFENGVTGKEMLFNLTDENGNAMREKPTSSTSGMTASEKRHQKNLKEVAAYNSLSNFQRLQRDFDQINRIFYKTDNATQFWCKLVSRTSSLADQKGNQFIKDVCDTCYKYKKMSEKQIYFVAKFADEAGIVIEDIQA